MGKNIRSLQLLRNTDLFNDKAAAIAGIQSGATNDGTVKLARYKEKVTSGEKEVEVIKTVFGICYNPSEDTTSGATGFSYTIYDSPQEVIAALKGRIEANEGAIKLLNSGDTVSGSVAYSIKTAIDALDVDAVGGEGQVITAISETDGKISATASALTAGIVAATAIEATDDTVAVTGTNVAAQIASLAQHIGGLDVIDNAVSGSYVSAVSETDGKITVTRAELPTVAEIKSEGQAIVAVKEDNGVISATAGDIAAAHVTIADASDHFTATTVEAALEELYSQAGAGSKVTLESADGTEGVLKVYTIKQGGKEVGNINIPKDLVVTSGSVVKGNWVDGAFTEDASGTGTALKLVIANQTAPVYINTLDLVKDHTAGDGIAISDTNVVSVVVDAASEGFLTVGKNGVKLSGVQAAIDKAAASATTKVVKVADADKITLTSSTASDGSVTYTIGQNDIASAALLGTTADTKESETAFGYIAKEVANREAAISGLNADVTSSNGTFVNVQVVEAEGKITAVTVSESDIASESATTDAINAEKAAREAEDAKIVAGVGLTVVDGAYKISGHTGEGLKVTSATTVEQAIYTLDNALAAAKKANTLTSSNQTIAINATPEGTDVNVNVVADTAENGDNNPFVTFDTASNKLIYCEAILDAGTY